MYARGARQLGPAVLVVEATGIRDVTSGPLLRNGNDGFLDGMNELVRVVREALDQRHGEVTREPWARPERS
jgi:hypothetical protein